MKRVKRTILILEAAAVSLVVGGINLLFPENPAFYSIFFIPYLLTALFFAVYGGIMPGIISFGVSSVTALGLVPLGISGIYGTADFVTLWKMFVPEVFIGLSAGIILSYLFGAVHERLVNEANALKERFKQGVKKNYRYSMERKALVAVNEELSERLSRQQESIMALFNQVKKIDTVSIDAVLSVLLETVHIFTQAKRASIWQYSPVRENLSLASNWGWEDEEGLETVMSAENTIEGWVVRNNQYFSVRMLLEYDNLQRIYSERNIITYPIQIDNKIWGVLNIEELPFIKYNLYTERLLFIIISLIEPVLKQALEYDAIMLRDEVDTLSGLPSFPSFYKVLQNEIDRKTIEQGKVSIIILDITNYSRLLAEHDEETVRGKVVPKIIRGVYEATENQGQSFQFKGENQFAFLFPNLDYDGASLYCLNILEQINSFEIDLGDTKTPLEAVIGFSSLSAGESSDDMIDKAENLLEMQKL